LPAQAEAIMAYVKSVGGTLVELYVDDGRSGRTIKRPAYQRMLREADKWDAILVLKMDRVHRSSRNFAAMMDDLLKAGKEFVAVMDRIDTSSAIGRFLMYVIQLIAQLESDQIGERTTLGHNQKRKTTSYWHGPPPPGYEKVAGGFLKVLKAQAEVMHMIFDMYNQGALPSVIAAWLNKNGHRTAAGGPFTKNRIDLILCHEGLAGIRMTPRSADTGNHDAVISVQTFVQSQERIRRTVNRVRQSKKSEAWMHARQAAINALARGEEYHVEF
jgi:site-specific DNA recombinase